MILCRFQVETIGDAYMVASGIPDKVDSHAERICNVGLGQVTAANEVRSPYHYGSLHGRHVQVEKHRTRACFRSSFKPNFLLFK
jgi:hypothetical protein